MRYYVLGAVFLSMAISAIVAQRTPQIVYITPNQVKDIGGSVELSCSVLYAQNYQVLWSKIDKDRSSDPVPLSTGTTPILRDSRFSLRYDKSSATYTLQIKDIQDTDAGFYKCQIIININNQISNEVSLQVLSPPVIYDNSSTTVIVSANDQVKLECYAGGFPRPIVSWKRENNAILPTGGSVYRGSILKINMARKEDRGIYYCIADNKVRQNVKKSVLVEVEFAPTVKATKSRVGQAVGYDADLECRVEAYPPAYIGWTKDNIQLSNDQHYKILQFDTVDEFTATTLRVVTVESYQYGAYRCEAVNKLGRQEAQVELYETDEPECPPACGAAHSLATNTAVYYMALATFLFIGKNFIAAFSL